MPFPKPLKSFRPHAEALLQAGAVTDVQFSGPTYQIAVHPAGEKEEWAFIQLDEVGHLKDSFCTCRDDSHGCIHLATAFLKIYERSSSPLHKRFEESLYRELFMALEEELGEDLTLSGKGKYQGKERIVIEALTPKGVEKLREIFEEKVEPTEETSLKFSNLPQEEILMWRQGRPSKKMSFELSFWSDFAKWLFLREDLSLQFSGNPPNQLVIHFRDAKVTVNLPTSLLERLIPTLPTVTSPLEVHGLEQEGIESIHFDAAEKKLHLTYKEKKAPLPEGVQGSDVGGWIYIPDLGFFAKGESGGRGYRVLEGEEIAELFDKFLPDVKRLIEGYTVDGEMRTPHYSLSIDRLHNLHIKSYLLEPGDLEKRATAFFGSWVFLPEKGFYRMEKSRFPSVETVIGAEEVSAFVGRERAWLGEHPGFETHQINAEAKLTFHVDKAGVLHFTSFLEGFDEKEEMIDFGPWIYIRGEGFYQKSVQHGGQHVRAGMAIPPQSVTLFIKTHYDELSLIPYFFAKSPAVLHSGLHIHLTPRGSIQVELRHQLREGLQKESLRFYDDYLFVPEEGFSKLPIDPRLLDRFQHDFEIAKKERDKFYETSFKELYPFALETSKELTPSGALTLIIDGIEKEEKGYRLSASYRSFQGEVPVKELERVLKEKERFAFTKAGAIDLHEERFHWLREKHQLFTSLELIRLTALENPLFRTPKEQEIWDEAISIKFSHERKEESLHAKLRPYQEKGVQWLLGLYQHGLSGILSDDMGLGKTLQALALVANVKKGHTLIVCPTSVIYHWQDKVHQFFPAAKLFTFYGSDRTLKGFHGEYDILLTSYGILRREIELIKQIPFEIAIFDEIQMAKNSKSKLHSALKKVTASMRIGLTGTPIENQLSELKALFDLTLPHYLPGETRFRELFQIPIERMQDEKRKKILSRMIHPFILRRIKSEVLLDLPEKIEEITYCPLLPEQHTLYQNALSARSTIVEEIKTNRSSPTLHIFTLLSRLKQICDHPAVFLHDVARYKNYRSGKWQRFEEILDEARESRQKVVLFSQYLRQLDIFKLYLQEKQIGFAEVRGSTQNRSDEIRRFHEDPDCEVFVASLQAAGLGIDLTPASVVIHYDRWWNAARENQATDRVHRIGQRRGVQVFKFVTRGTFEERIHAMIERKGKLMEDVVGVDDQDLIKSFTREELLELLSDVKLTEEDQPLFLDDPL